MIVHRMMPDGAFVAGDTESRVTFLAAPDTEMAYAAKVSPQMVAVAMVASEEYFRKSLSHEYDPRNWELLNAGKDTE